MALGGLLVPGLALCGLAGHPWALGGPGFFLLRSSFIPDEGMPDWDLMTEGRRGRPKRPLHDRRRGRENPRNPRFLSNSPGERARLSSPCPVCDVLQTERGLRTPA